MAEVIETAKARCSIHKSTAKEGNVGWEVSATSDATDAESLETVTRAKGMLKGLLRPDQYDLVCLTAGISP